MSCRVPYPLLISAQTSKRTTRRPQVANGAQAPTLPLHGFAFPPAEVRQDPLLEAIAGINGMVDGDGGGQREGGGGEEELKAGLIRLATQLKMFAASSENGGE